MPTYLAETGVEIGDRGPANAINAAMLISGGMLIFPKLNWSHLTREFYSSPCVSVVPFPNIARSDGLRYWIDYGFTKMNSQG